MVEQVDEKFSEKNAWSSEWQSDEVKRHAQMKVFERKINSLDEIS